MTPEQLAPTIQDLIADTADELGLELKETAEVTAAYAAERAAYLSVLVGQPGYADAVRAERDSVAMQAGIALAAQATGAEQRMLGILQGVLQIGATILVA